MYNAYFLLLCWALEKYVLFFVVQFGELSDPVPVIRGLEAFQFKVRVDSNLVSQGHVFDSTGCLHQLLKAQEFRRGSWNILNNTDDDNIQLSFDE